MEYVCLHYESLYFKELHNEQEYYLLTIYRTGAAVVSTFTSVVVQCKIDFQKSPSSDFIWREQKRLAPLAKRSTCSESKCKITELNSISDPTKWYIETHNTPRHDSRATLTGVRTRLLPWFAVFVHLKVRWKRWSQLSFLVQPHAKVSPLPVNKNSHSFDGVERTLMSLN